MRTIGIDFAAQPRETAICEIAWEGSSATLVQLSKNVTDAQIRQLVAGPSPHAIGVDIPFGWPKDFVAFVSAQMQITAPLPVSSMEQKRLRATDRFIKGRFPKSPLSVSTDKIGIPAMRWAALSREFGLVNRAGDGRFYEVYPAVARIVWGLSGKTDNVTALDQILEACPFNCFSPGLRSELLVNEHCFDALLCALVARAAALGLTHLPPADLLGDAEAEGWIHAPQADSLERLVTTGLIDDEALSVNPPTL